MKGILLKIQEGKSKKGFQPIEEFGIYRRNLPHWEGPGHLYFITFRTYQDFILPEEARQIVLNSCKFHNNKKYDLYACVVMPDHIHLILQPLEKRVGAFYSIAEITHSIKSYSAKQIINIFYKSYPVFHRQDACDTEIEDARVTKRKAGRTGVSPVKKIWLGESFDRIIRDENELLEKINYIINNPVKKGLVEKPEDYKWLIIKGWLE
jgi:REP element-mobilizing transposase RayT